MPVRSVQHLVACILQGETLSKRGSAVGSPLRMIRLGTLFICPQSSAVGRTSGWILIILMWAFCVKAQQETANPCINSPDPDEPRSFAQQILTGASFQGSRKGLYI